MFLLEFLRIALLFGAFGGSFLLRGANGKNNDIYTKNKGQFVKDIILSGKRQLKENGKSRFLVFYPFSLFLRYPQYSSYYCVIFI